MKDKTGISQRQALKEANQKTGLFAGRQQKKAREAYDSTLLGRAENAARGAASKVGSSARGAAGKVGSAARGVADKVGDKLGVDERERLVYEIIMAVDQMRKAKIGALIVIERDVSLLDYINKSTNLYAEISSELLVSLFFPNNPLHDGGVIIQGDRISCAGAVFPTSNSLKINKRLGTRHRAALGISEETDAISIIVSEETGRVSIAIKGELYYNLSIDDARILLIDELRPKHESFEEEFDEEEDV